LNEKSDEDDSNSKHSELLKCLQNPTKDQKELNNNADLDNEALKQRLRFQGSFEGNSRKRPSDESDDANPGAPKNRLSNLQQKNKMLAQLLAGPSRPLNASAISNLQGISVVRPMPDIALAKQLSMDNQQQASTPNQNIPNNNNKTMNNNNNSVTKNNNLKSQQQKSRQQNLIRQQSMPGGKNLKQMGENVYLAQLQSHQQQQMAMNRAANVLTSSANSQSPFDGGDGSQFVTSSPAITLAAASSSSTIQSDSVIDPELNDILENLFDDGSYNEDPAMNFLQHVNNINNNAQLKQQEELAQINKIQQSLMECEDEANFSGSPPAYPLAALTAQARLQQAGYSQPPPGYNQQRNSVRLPQMSSVTSNNSNNTSNNNNIVTNSNTTAVAQTTNIQKNINTVFAERFRLQQQQLEQKHRLLQQQQNQQIVVTAGADQMCKLNVIRNFRSFNCS